MIRLIHYRPRLWVVLFAANLTLVLLPFIGIVFSGVIETQQVRTVERELQLQAVQWATFYRAETFHLWESEEWLMDYPELIDPSSRDNKHWYGVFGIRSPQLDPRLVSPNRSEVYPKIFCSENDGLSDSSAKEIGDKLQPLLDLRPDDEVSIRILDRYGVVVAQTPKTPCDRLPIEENAPIGDALGGIDQSSLHRNEKSELPSWAMLISHWGARDVVVTYPVTMRNKNNEKVYILAMVVLSKTPSSMLNLVSSQLNRTEIWFLLLILIMSLFIVTGIVTVSITRPFQRVRKQMRRAIDGERGAVKQRGRSVTRDVKDFTRDIASLAKKLEQREQKTRALADFVAHTVRTRMGTTIYQIDALRGESLSARGKHAVSKIENDKTLLVRMADRMMELAKWEAITFGQGNQAIVDQAEKIHVDQMLRKLENDPDTPSFDLKVHSNANGQSVKMNEEWFDSFLYELIVNANEHGGEGAKVAITLELAKNRQRSLAIQVHNTGQRIESADRGKVFIPGVSRSPSGTHRGLGLSIVKALVEAHNGTIDLIDAGSGTTFEVLLPIQ